MFHKRSDHHRSDKSSLPPTTELSPEHALIQHAQDGDQAAFEILYERYNDRICRYLCRMTGDDGIGCELTQETFLKAWLSLRTLHNPASFPAWLYRIATNCAYSYQNHNKPHRTIAWEECRQEVEHLSVAGPEEQVAQTELLRLALARVSPTYRPSLILAVVERLPQRQIAEILGMKEASVSQYVNRGRKELRQLYLRLSGESTTNITQRGHNL